MSVFPDKTSPVTVPVLALRGLVVFPRIDTSFEVARAESVKSVEMALRAAHTLLLVTQKDLDSEPDPEKLYETGVVARIKQSLKLPNGSYRLVVEGVSRARAAHVVKLKSGALVGEAAELPELNWDKTEGEALRRYVLEQFREFYRLAKTTSPDLASRVYGISDPGFLADYMAANLLNRTEDKMKVLAENDPIERIEIFSALFAEEIEIVGTEQKIQEKVQRRVDRQQREYYLREQLQVIQNELGNKAPENPDDELFPEELDLKSRVETTPMPEDVREKLKSQVNKLASMPFGSSEAAVITGYVETCLEVPWMKYSEDTLDLDRARRILDEDHEGLEKVKERILEYLAAKKLGGAMKGQILCLVGAPGVGKTSIAASIARAMNKKYARISLGGVRDEADIRGHRKTYIGSMPGRIITALRDAGTMNPLVCFDEVDKLSHDLHGDPASALLEVLDSEQNHAFRDHFIELPVDLSRCMFLCTANEVDTIPPALVDRMEIIRLQGYTETEKIAIAKKHLLPRQEKEHGIKRSQLRVSDRALVEIIRSYTREQGVRTLERDLARICRKTAKNVVDGHDKTSVTEKNLADFLGKRKYLPDAEDHEPRVGVVNGLAWTISGGELLKVEALAVPGTGKLELTGSLGDVMKESARAALTYIRANREELGIADEDFYKKYDLHIHLPEGAVPKDGPSAGVTLITCLASLFSGKKCRGDLAMTGEITLHGEVLPIGGLREKTGAALRSGMTTVLFPADNRKDLDEVDPKVLEKMKLIPVKTAREVLGIALMP